MAAKTPVRGDFNSSGDLTGLSEFLSSDFIDIAMVVQVQLLQQVLELH